MLGSSLIVSILSLSVSLISFINQLIIAKLFGATVLMDSYLIAVSVPMLVSGAINGVMSYSFVPFLIKHKENAERYDSITMLTFIILNCISLIIAVVGIASAPLFISNIGKAMPQEVQASAMLMFRISWVTNGFAIAAGHLAAMHNASKRFYLPVMVSILPFLFMILFGLTFGNNWGPVAITWGMLFGYVLMVLVLTKTSLLNYRLSKKLLLFWKDAVNYFTQVPLVLLGMLCFTVYQSIDAYWAPKIGDGNLAYLGYCQRILIAVGGIIIAGPFVVMVPRLSEAFNAGRLNDFMQDTGRAVRMVIAFAALFAITVSIIALPLVELLFQRGSFDAHATQGVAALMPLMMTGMVAMLSVAMLFRAFYARRDVFSPSVLGVVATITYFALSGLFSRYWGAKGIAAAYAMSWWILLIAATYLLSRKHREPLISKNNILFAVHLIISLIVVSVVVMWGMMVIVGAVQKAGFLGKVLALSLVTGSAVVTFYVMMVRVFRTPDISYIFDFVFDKLAIAAASIQRMLFKIRE